MSSMFSSLIRFAHSFAGLKTAGGCCLMMLVSAVAAQPAVGAIIVDGNVGGIGEGYTQEHDVTFNIEKGPTGVGGGKLFLADNGASISVGFVTPLIINDNTYGATRASDWGTKDHFLMGGGNGLEGSDKWEIKIKDFSGRDDLEFKFDYIKYDQNATNVFDAKIEKFKIGSDLSQSLVDLGTSLDYNHNVLGLTQFFDPDKDNPIDSPQAASGGSGGRPSGNPVVYDFASPAEDWIPEIMYEFELQKSTFDGTGFALSMDSFRNVLFVESVFHMSPNKLGGHKVFVNGVSPVPEPSNLNIWAILGVLGVAMRWHRSRKA